MYRISCYWLKGMDKVKFINIEYKDYIRLIEEDKIEDGAFYRVNIKPREGEYDSNKDSVDDIPIV